MDIEKNTDTLLLTADGPVEKQVTYEESEVTHSDVKASDFTAETTIEGHQEISVTVSPTPELETHLEGEFEDDHRGLVTWIFASYLDNATEGWYPIRYDEWAIELTTAKPGEHPDNLFRLCAKERANRDGSTMAGVLREWATTDYFDTEIVKGALQVAESNSET